MPFPANLPAIQDRLANWWEFGEQEAPCLVISTVPDEIDGLAASVGTRGLLAVIGGATCDEAEMLMEKYGAG